MDFDMLKNHIAEETHAAFRKGEDLKNFRLVLYSVF